MIRAKLGLGPMSTEIIESVFSYSHTNRVPLMLIASMNQINYAGGYVNGWTTKEYMQHISKLRKRFPQADITICRDHCGPGLSFQKLDPLCCIEDDIKCGFDLIHLDWSRDKECLFENTIAAIAYAKSLRCDIMLEIGTDAIDEPVPSVKNVTLHLERLCSEVLPEFYVVNTGSRVKDYTQVGTFESDKVYELSLLLHSHGIKVKEHNADYLTTAQVRSRDCMVDAMNIAPQLGVVQTLATLFACYRNKVDADLLDKYIDVVLESGDYRQWELHKHSRIARAVMAGHYRFNTPEYKELQRLSYNKIEPYIWRVIDTYVLNR